MREDTRREKAEPLPGTDAKVLVIGSGRRVTFWDALNEAKRAESPLVRWLSRAAKLSVSEYDDELLRCFLDDLEELVTAHRKEGVKRGQHRNKEQRIAQLRNVEGRTPQERESFLHKADELEHRLKH